MPSCAVPTSAVRVSSSTQGTGTAGTPYSITCVLTKPAALSAMPDITWVNPQGTEVSGQANSTQIGSVTTLSVGIELNPLLASHNGVYTCEASFPASSLLASLNLSSTVSVSVQCESLHNGNIECNYMSVRERFIFTFILSFYSTITRS